MSIDKIQQVNCQIWKGVDYVKGGYLTEELVKLAPAWSLGNIKKIRASFHEQIASHVEYHLLDPPVQGTGELKNYSAAFELTTDKGTWRVGVKKHGKTIETRTVFDEDTLVTSHAVDEQNRSATVIKCAGKELYQIVALNKKLLHALLPQKGYSRWFLAKYDLNWALITDINTEALKLVLKSTIGGVSARTSVFIDESEAGVIYFSRIKE